MTTHDLWPTRATVHGHFSAGLPPALRLEPGDSVVARTPASWDALDFPRTVLDAGHVLLGPISVRGAEAGDALAVEIVRLRPARTGITLTGDRKSPVNDRLGLTGTGRHQLDWQIDPDGGRARTMDFEVDVHAFLGVIGMPPPTPGVHSTIPPRPTGGNLDCRELVAGSTLVLPVESPGGLLSFGDGHAAQGDGEVSSTALECAMDEVELRIDLLKRAQLQTPEAYTSVGFITFGFDEDLDQAMLAALEAMMTRLECELSLDRTKAIALASVAVDLRVTQVVNQVVGVHALLPAGRLRRAGRPVVIEKRHPEIL